VVALRQRLHPGRLCRVLAAGFVPALALAGGPAWAAGKVQLELVGDSAGSALVFQEWVQALGKAGVANVRIRASRPTDQVGIQVHGSRESPLYVVTGVVVSRDELSLPGARFRRNETGRLKQWLDDLSTQGPADQRPARGAFGLTAGQFAVLREDLAQPVGFVTRGETRREVVEKIRRRLNVPLALDPEAAEAIGDDKVEEELQDLSCGTALACVLRVPGLCLVAREAGARPGLAVVKARRDLEIWPIGWQPEKPPKDVLPGLFEFLNINLEKVPVTRALEAMGQRLKSPVLLDHNAMARHGIDVAAATVTLPRTRTTHSLALRKFLFQAGLKFEVRLDEAGKPFLWISTVKPV